MKISDCIIDFKETGVCKIDVNKLIKRFGKSSISKYGPKYTLINRRAKIKIAISEQQAKEIIHILNLFELKSVIFNNASVFYNYQW